MTRWLTDDEQRAWRAWIEASILLNQRLSTDLQRLHDLTLADYEILVHLSEHSERRMRMSELAEATLVSRSRLSHQVDRLVKRGFVERQECDADKRAPSQLDQRGLDAIETAAPIMSTAFANTVDVLGPRASHPRQCVPPSPSTCRPPSRSDKARPVLLARSHGRPRHPWSLPGQLTDHDAVVRERCLLR